MSDLTSLGTATDGALKALREKKSSTDPSILLKQYREMHEKDGCRVITYTPDYPGRLPLLADARCTICKEFDKQNSGS